MSFRQRQKFHPAGCSPVVFLESKTLENGVVVQEMVDQSEKVLPKPELFDLENQLKAGVNLEEVNSKVFSAKSVNADEVIGKFTQSVKPTEKPTNNKE